MSVRNPARSSDRKTIPAHPMGIIQQRPRGMDDLFPIEDWYEGEWWRIRLSRLLVDASLKAYRDYMPTLEDSRQYGE